MKEFKTVVVLSGGMDSTTLLYKVLKEVGNPDEVKAISFDYGQRHKIELELAKKTCEKLGIEHKIVDITSLNVLLQGSSLTTEAMEVPKGHYEDVSMKKTVVPNRNSILANIAIGYAVSLGYGRVALGVHSGDHAIYPDCRPVWVKALNVLADVSNYEPVEIYAPYLDTDKGGIIHEGTALNVDYALTWTCYDPKNGEACGKCGSCQERLEAFKNNGIEDPIKYSLT
jgi:7-cyano-7-deazaguanine synthase